MSGWRARFYRTALFESKARPWTSGCACPSSLPHNQLDAIADIAYQVVDFYAI